MLILLSCLALTACITPGLIHIFGRPAFALVALVPAAGFVWTLQLIISGRLHDTALTVHIGWLSTLHLDLTFRMDALSAFFSLIILGIGALILFYCWGYFDSNPGRLSMFGGYMVCFMLAMFGLVISDNLLLMYIFWEITSVLSFLLVGYYSERASSRRAALQALLVTTLGGLAMLVGIIVLGTTSGVWQLSQIPDVVGVSDLPYMTAAVVLILAGALSKSAIAPMHFWLPGAMAAPTPVSAYLHSAAMVKAGIYLVARLSPDLNQIAAWHLVIIPLGLGTMLMGGLMALRQKDLKLILAYRTVSQLGFIISVISIGSREATQAGLALTAAHALFKATLFMVVGAIDHCTGTRDVTKLSGLAKKQPGMCVLAGLAAASMAGFPPLLGFVAKETALDAVLGEQLLTGMPGKLILTGLVLGSVLTMAYSCFFLYAAFATKPAQHPSGGGISEPVRTMNPIGPTLWLAPLVLVCITILGGLLPQFVDRPISDHLASAFETEQLHGLALWHGLSPALGLSAVIIAGGAIVFWQRAWVTKLQFRVPALGSANAAYDAVIRFLMRISLRITASTQRGSLMINLGIIFSVLVVLPLSVLLLGQRTNVRMELWSSPWQAIAASIIIVVCVAVTRVRNRLSALIMVGVTGYCLAVLFALHGAPDLALTQVLVETVVMVIFMLVLRKIPAHTQWQGTAKGNRLRAWLSIAVGLSVVIVALYAMNARNTIPVSAYIPDLAYEIGHGRNAVNVLLVDIRGWDTFGETTVLIIAAIGVASLIYGTRSFVKPSRRPTLSTLSRRWLAAGVDSEKARNRSIMVDVVTRIAFPSIMAVSLYFFFAGHNAPGGGFAGGLVASLAFFLRYLAGGREELEQALPVDAGRILGTGLILSATAVVLPMFFGRPPLSSQVWDLHLPLVGEMHLPSALLFDAGVYVIVVGLSMHILLSLGSQIDQDEALRKQRARDRARSLARANRKRAAKGSDDL